MAAVTSDMRVYAWHRLVSIPLSQLVAYWSPRLFSLTDWGSVEGSVDGNEQIVLPPSIPLSSESMTQEGAYLIENGESMLLWIGKYEQKRSRLQLYIFLFLGSGKKQRSAWLVQFRLAPDCVSGDMLHAFCCRSAPSEWLLAVFGVSALDFLHPEAAAASIGQTNDPLGIRTFAMISELQRQRLKPDYMQLTIIRQGDSNEQQ